jgi:hypothetical protein
LLPWDYEREFKYIQVSTKKKTSGIMLGFYILFSESLVEVDQLTIEFKGIENKMKVKVVRPCKVEFKDINKNSKVELV